MTSHHYSGSSTGHLTNSIMYVDGFKKFVFQALQRANVTLVFDRYFPNSSRISRGCRELGQVAHTSWQQICELLLWNKFLLTLKTRSSWIPCLLRHFWIYNNATEKHSLVIAGVGDVPVEIDSGVRIDRHDLCSSQEADIFITQHAIALGLLSKSVNVVCDDTDVFVLLVHFYNSQFKASNPPCSCHHQ